MPLSLDILPDLPPTPEAEVPKTLIVSYGYQAYVGEFPSDIKHRIAPGTKVVCRTSRGTELAATRSHYCGGCAQPTSSVVDDYARASGGKDFPFSRDGRVLRVATAQDLAEQAQLETARKRDLGIARELADVLRLEMRVVEVEYLLGNERLLFYFTAEHRVDFRQLVRDMAQHFHTRIELRQVGARDEARITAEYEKCGQRCCCKQFLKVLVPISMRNAKIQKATLDPTKISGRCGRLMCCLRYEEVAYDDLKARLPHRHVRVRTDKGPAWVMDTQIITQLVMVLYDNGDKEAIAVDDIRELNVAKPTLPNGQIMQNPFDRMPEVAGEERPNGNGDNRPPRGGPQRGPQQNRDRDRGPQNRGPQNRGPESNQPRAPMPPQAPKAELAPKEIPPASTGGDI